MHINEIYNSYELDEKSTSKKFLLVQNEGDREVKRNVLYYNLDMAISVGYRVNSERAVQFRRWATNILKEFSKKGYIIDKKRMENGSFFDEDYYESLLAEIRKIRLSERRFYQKITDIYATSVDYDKKSPTTINFFKKIQNKMHYAVSKQTAAEIIYNRVDSKKEYMGLTSWKNSPNGKILETDVVIAKNYLSQEELKDIEEEFYKLRPLVDGINVKIKIVKDKTTCNRGQEYCILFYSERKDNRYNKNIKKRYATTYLFLCKS